jgi:hypothetical protein
MGAAGFWRPFLFASAGSSHDLCCIAKDNMLLCKQTGCCWHLVYVDLSLDHGAAQCCTSEKGTIMSKTASIGFAPSNNLFGRLMAAIDRLLMTSARAAVRNGDLPYFGL